MRAKKTDRVLVVTGPYKDLTVALYEGEQEQIIRTKKQARASKDLIPLIDELLASQGWRLGDLTYIAANTGPGAFTSLRVVLTTLNGLATAVDVPFVSCDGMEALDTQIVDAAIAEGWDTLAPVQVVLLNAFNNEVYYRVVSWENQEPIIEPGYDDVADVVTALNSFEADKVAVGNGIIAYRDYLSEHLMDTEYLPLLEPSAQALHTQSRARWRVANEPEYELKPAYLKTQTFKKQGE
jgi:tRNA threonylcarbamoyl adenosine modification protein YeaZ